MAQAGGLRVATRPPSLPDDVEPDDAEELEEGDDSLDVVDALVAISFPIGGDGGEIGV